MTITHIAYHLVVGSCGRVPVQEYGKGTLRVLKGCHKALGFQRVPLRTYSKGTIRALSHKDVRLSGV